MLDRHVVSRLRGVPVERYGRNPAAGRSRTWTRPWFEDFGLYRLRGTIRYRALRCQPGRDFHPPVWSSFQDAP